ncbi:MAG: cytochrome c3 family protein [Deltaproteobacteria bacterium]|nr:cytochrome c3 family protein [Deltaproteobacteria bacterium]MBW2255147.1 cytochrome c3 family protein [Deltaproteobacteria bacterium]
MSARCLVGLAVLLVGCGRLTDGEPGTSGASFPHPDGYEHEGHGADSLAEDATCAECHRPFDETDALGPACISCHAAYPHIADFHLGSVHGVQWLGDPEGCVDCHGEDGTLQPGGAEHATCVGCHSTYPHAQDWRQHGQHGAGVVERGGPTACVGCHGEAFDAYPSGRCTNCHVAYPHPDGWLDPLVHGVSAQVGDCGSSCHASEDVLWTPTCTTCHDLFPHPQGWSLGHIPVVQSRGESSCWGCHSAVDLSPPLLPVSCGSACHKEAAL